MRDEKKIKPPQAKSSKPARPNYFLIIKTTLILLLFFAASIYFAVICGRVSAGYLGLIMNPVANIGLLIEIFVSIGLLSAAAGLSVSLIRPAWLISIGFAVSAILIVIVLGIGINNLVIGALYAAVSLTYGKSVAGKLENQIKFSMYPLEHGQKFFLLLLTVIICASFGLGYKSDADNRNFIIPPEIKTAAENFMLQSTEDSINKMEKQPSAEEKKAALEQTQQNMDKSWANLEDQMKLSFMMPLAVGTMFFSVLQIVMMLLSWVPLLVLQIIFSLFKVTHFTKITTEKKEVEILTLN